jgi:hypothetical protein
VAVRVPFGGAAMRMPLGGVTARMPLGGVAVRMPLSGPVIRFPFGGAAVRMPFGGAMRIPFGGAMRIPFGRATIRLPFGESDGDGSGGRYSGNSNVIHHLLGDLSGSLGMTGRYLLSRDLLDIFGQARSARMTILFSFSAASRPMGCSASKSTRPRTSS